MKVPLSIKVDYLPDWGVWEGIRELVQNGKDAEVQLEAPLKVTHKNQTLVIENEGAMMEREALLFGATTKDDRDDLIGRFGEGLKLAMLALVRAGRPIKIRVGSEVWIPTIEKSDGFKANVLVVDIKGGNEAKKRVRAEIGGVTSVEWDAMRERFLFLSQPNEDERVKVYSGELLLGERFKHKVFVKGIWVQDKPKLSYGYNFKNAKLDRDRKMVESFDMDWTAASIWKEAASTRPDLFEKFIVMAQNDDDDIRGVELGYVSPDLSDLVAKRFKTQHGDGAVPVSNLAESEKVEHLGAKGVIVPKAFAKLLAPAMGGAEELDRRLREMVTKKYAWVELDEKERQNLLAAIALLAAVYPPCTLDRIDVVDFGEPDIYGQWKELRASVARKLLVDSAALRRVIVHEFAHEYGGEGSKSHVDNIERLWEAVANHLLENIESLAYQRETERRVFRPGCEWGVATSAPTTRPDDIPKCRKVPICVGETSWRRSQYVLCFEHSQQWRARWTEEDADSDNKRPSRLVTALGEPCEISPEGVVVCLPEEEEPKT